MNASFIARFLNLGICDWSTSTKSFSLFTTFTSSKIEVVGIIALKLGRNKPASTLSLSQMTGMVMLWVVTTVQVWHSSKVLGSF